MYQKQKEAGMVLAARFALFTGDRQLASRISQRLLEGYFFDLFLGPQGYKASIITCSTKKMIKIKISLYNI